MVAISLKRTHIEATRRLQAVAKIAFAVPLQLGDWPL
jgi:hypothetical protein